MLGFETLTLCPIDLDLVDRSIMTNDEITWLNEYHAMVFEKLSPHLGDENVAWLGKKTRPI